MKKLFIIIAYYLILAGCSKSANEPVPEKPDLKVSDLTVIDYDNKGNSSDIRVTFTKPDEVALISTFRLFILESAQVSSFDLKEAISSPNGTYHDIDISEITIDIELPDALPSADGQSIIEGTPYQIVVLSKGVDESDSQLSEPSSEFMLARTNLVRTLVTTVYGGSGGMAIDKDGSIYMADFGQTLGGPPGDKVFRISMGGQVSIFATGFIGASGNDFDSKGNLFQSNIAGQSISKITPAGEVTIFASGSPIVNTVGISIDNNDVLFVADCDGHQILKIDQAGNISVFSSSNLLRCPNGITRDGSGNLYVSNFYNGDVVKISPAGTASLMATLPGNNNGHLTYHEGSLYVIARTANQIYKIDLQTEEVTLFAGSGRRGSQDGSALQASFSLPNDLVFNREGNKIYLNDVVPNTGNDISPCSIRVIEIAQ